ncbi:flagellar motor protein MotB [Erythrobacter aureus]|uniref:Flagellar motor protein MotB n=1 Tax=Erythrobacter aureus TaxID=2182384 RepID=A0A345YIG0_9SPHN|nr:flagellar motor protein MotB [Erythrobacter aureus]AXK43712.1 flagellar motor protein MotB [Erythrobacter aureus]
MDGTNEKRPIVIRRVKKVSGGGHHGGAWKVAYADFVTAMMAFFMLLWLISSPDDEMKQGLADYFSPADPGPQEAVGAAQAAAGSSSAGNSRNAQSSDNSESGVPSMEAATAGASRGGTASVPDASLRVLAQELLVELDNSRSEQDASDHVQVQPNEDTIRINLMDSSKRAMFKSGTAQLNPYAKSLLNRISRKVAKSGVGVAIEGHTDGRGGMSEANWRLSGDRAQAARNAMVQAGVPADRFQQIIAMAGSRPVYPDQPDRPENRRITIVLKASGSALPPDTTFTF